MLRAHAALGSYANQFSMLETPRTTCVALHRPGGARVLGARRRFAALPLPAGRAHRRDQGPLEGPVPRRPGHHRRRRRRRASRPQQDLQLPGRSRRPGHRPVGKRTPLRNGDVIVMCTDGLWSVLTREEIATWLTSTPILKTAPQMMREAEKRGGPDGDNLSAIVVRWGPETLADEPSTTITETLGLGEFETQIDRTLTLTDRKGVAARPLRRRDRARDRRDPGDDPALPVQTRLPRRCRRSWQAPTLPVRDRATRTGRHRTADSVTRCARSSSTPKPRASTRSRAPDHRARGARARRPARRPAAPSTSTSTRSARSTPARPRSTA